MKINERTRKRLLKNLQSIISDLMPIITDRENEKHIVSNAMAKAVFSSCVMLRNYLDNNGLEGANND